MRNQVRLDFLGVDFLATAIDQVLDSSFDDQVAGRIEPHQVAGAVKSVGGERFAIALGRAVVTAERVRSATPKLADRAGRDLGSVGVDDTDLIGRRERPALGRKCNFVAVVEMRVAQQSLGHPEHLLHDEMRKSALECARSWLLEPLSADRDDAQRRELEHAKIAEGRAAQARWSVRMAGE